MPSKLEDLPATVEVAWFGKKWDEGCTDDIRVYAPEGEFCHGCFDPLGVRSSGVAERQRDGTWHYYDPACWGDLLKERYAKDTLEADAEYEGRPHPSDW